jgi:mono/diheme cytochrome c family protein
MPMSRIEPAKLSSALSIGVLAATGLALIGWALPAAHADEERRSQCSLSTGFRFTESTGEQLFANVCQGCHMPDGGGATGAGNYPHLPKTQISRPAAIRFMSSSGDNGRCHRSVR